MRCVLVKRSEQIRPGAWGDGGTLPDSEPDASADFLYAGVHVEYTCSRSCWSRCRKWCTKYKAPLLPIFLETRTETDECLERYGMTPPQFLDSLGLFDYGGGGYPLRLFHGRGYGSVREKGLHIITNPRLQHRSWPAAWRRLPVSWKRESMWG